MRPFNEITKGEQRKTGEKVRVDTEFVPFWFWKMSILKYVYPKKCVPFLKLSSFILYML